MHVIFVCTGNTCRSPLAEALARQLAEQRGLTDVTFSSAGIGAFDGAPASDASVLVGIERGLDLSTHRSRAFDESILSDDTLVLALSDGHLAAVHRLVPEARAYLLDEYATHGERHRSVRDPFGGELDDYRVAADDIEEMLQGVMDRLASEQRTGPR